MLTLLDLKKELKNKTDPKRAKITQRFFKTGPGEYGEGDVFLGIIAPDIKKVVKKYNNLKIEEVIKLLHSKIHEERVTALRIIVKKFPIEENKEKIYNLYLKNTKYINNWDLVDLSADRIVGDYLLNKPKLILYKLARSKSIWERRISIIATFNFIKNNEFEETLKIAKIL